MKFLTIPAFIFFLTLQFQTAAQSEQPAAVLHQPVSDTLSLLQAFSKGRVNGHFRQFNMATDNAPGLMDYYGLAIGTVMQYETRNWHGFSLALGGELVTNISSSDFTVPDPVTGAYSRYDLGLYNILDPADKSFLLRLSDLSMGYRWKQNSMILGKQALKTPFVNPQDGRMNASIFEGMYGYLNPGKSLHFEGGWLWKASPRSTYRWFGIAESVGLYPQGVKPEGGKADYHNNISSAGLLMFNARMKHWAGTFDFWNYYFENVLNTALLQWTKTYEIEHKTHPYRLQFGTQFIRQDAINDGGNPDPALTYVTKNSHSWVFSGFAAWSRANTRVQLNATRITADGRFLFPREWGREPMFTFLPRERNEGFGDVWAFSGQLTRQFKRLPLEGSVAAGYYKLPEVKNYRLNKYGLPSYAQINVEARYRFAGRLEGMDVKFLTAWKFNTGNIYGEERYRINKVDMTNYNLIFNYTF